MRLLLDTHLAVWAVDAPHRLTAQARRHIEAAEEVVVSVVSIWEVAVKHALGSRRPDPILISGTQAREQFVAAGFTLLPVTAAHAAAIDDLPPIHADPFDRMLIAQARTEPLHLLTSDRRLEAYGAMVMMV